MAIEVDVNAPRTSALARRGGSRSGTTAVESKAESEFDVLTRAIHSRIEILNGRIDSATHDVHTTPVASAAQFLCRGFDLSCLEEPERKEAALRDFTRSLELESSLLPLGHYLRGCLHDECDRPNEALSDLSRAIEIVSQFDECGWKKALSDMFWTPDFRAQLDLGFADFCRKVYGARGSVLKGLGRTDEALSDFSKAVEMVSLDETAIVLVAIEGEEPNVDYSDVFGTPKMSKKSAFIRRAELFENLGRKEEAVRDFGELLALFEGDTDLFAAKRRAHFLERRARLLENLGETDRALEDYSKAIELDPRFAMDAYLSRANLLASLKGKEQEAVDDLTKLVDDLDRGNVEACLLRGSLYVRLRQNTLALKDFTTVIRIIDPSEARAYVCRARLYERFVERDEACKDQALADATKALELDPSNKDALAILDRLTENV